MKRIKGKIYIETQPDNVTVIPDIQSLGILTSTGEVVTIPMDGGEGSYSPNGLAKSYFVYGNYDLSNNQVVAALLNANQDRVPSGTLDITDQQTPVYLQFTTSRNSTLGSKKYIYGFVGGTGSWGSVEDDGGQEVAAQMLQMLDISDLTVQDVTNDPNTVTIPLGTLPDGNYLSAANSQSRDLSNPESVYYFSYQNSNNELFLVQFVGEPGIYGAGNMPLQQSDLVPATNSTVQPVFDGIPRAGTETGRPVTGDLEFDADGEQRLFKYFDPNTGSYIEFPDEASLLIGSEANGIKGGLRFTQGRVQVEADEASVGLTAPFEYPNNGTDRKVFPQTGFVLDNIKGYQDPAIDIFISNSPNSTLTYKTDIYRTFDLQPYMPNDTVFITSQIVRFSKNDFCVIANSSIGYITAITIKGMKIVNNIMTIESLSYGRVSEDLSATVRPDHNRVHSAALMNGFVFLSTRPDDNAFNSRLIKFNPYNISDFKFVEFPVSNDNYKYQTTEIRAYKNYIYLLFAQGGSNPANIVRVDENLNTPELVFQAGNVSSLKRIRRESNFVIYNDEIYIPTINNQSAPNAYDTMGVSVYSMTGTIKRENNLLSIGTGNTISPFYHWMTIFNGKIVVVSILSNKFIARIDCNTLALEEVLRLPNGITHRNSINADGYIYLNEEKTSNQTIPLRLLKLNYKNFTDSSVEITPYNGELGSFGSIEPLINQDGLKTKLSDFKDDQQFKTVGGQSIRGTGDIPVGSGGGSQTLQQTTDLGATTTNTVTVQNATTPSINTVIAPASVKVIVPDGRAVEISAGEGAKLTNSLGFTTTIDNAGVPANNNLKAPRGTGTLGKSVSLNGGTPIPFDVNGNVDIPVASGNFTRTLISDAVTYNVTNATSESIVKSYVIPAGTLTGGGMVNIFNQIYFTGTAGTKNMKLYFSNNPGIDANHRATLNSGTTSVGTVLDRTFFVESNGNFKIFNRGISAPSDRINQTNLSGANSVNLAQDIYITISTLNGSGADTTSLNGTIVTFNKTTP